MIIRVKDKCPEGPFTRSELEHIAASLTIAYENQGVGPVYRGIVAPADTSIPWQETDALGTPIGPVKHYRAGGWR